MEVEKPSPNNIFMRFFFTTKKCELSGVHFKWEWGYRILVGPFHGGFGRWVYIRQAEADKRGLSIYDLFTELYKTQKRKVPPPPMRPQTRGINEHERHKFDTSL